MRLFACLHPLPPITIFIGINCRRIFIYRFPAQTAENKLCEKLNMFGIVYNRPCERFHRDYILNFGEIVKKKKKIVYIITFIISLNDFLPPRQCNRLPTMYIIIKSNDPKKNYS